MITRTLTNYNFERSTVEIPRKHLKEAIETYTKDLSLYCFSIIDYDKKIEYFYNRDIGKLEIIGIR